MYGQFVCVTIRRDVDPETHARMADLPTQNWRQRVRRTHRRRVTPLGPLPFERTRERTRRVRLFRLDHRLHTLTHGMDRRKCRFSLDVVGRVVLACSHLIVATGNVPRTTAFFAQAFEAVPRRVGPRVAHRRRKRRGERDRRVRGPGQVWCWHDQSDESCLLDRKECFTLPFSCSVSPFLPFSCDHRRAATSSAVARESASRFPAQAMPRRNTARACGDANVL